LHHLAFLKAGYDVSFFPTSSPTPVVGIVFAKSFWVEFFGSLRYRIISTTNRDILRVSLPICIPFISLSCLIALARNSRNLLNRSGDSGGHRF
jgi:hypothetical protein